MVILVSEYRTPRSLARGKGYRTLGGSSPELRVQFSCVRNGEIRELREGPLLHPDRCPMYVSVFLSFLVKECRKRSQGGLA